MQEVGKHSVEDIRVEKQVKGVNGRKNKHRGHIQA